MTKKEIASLAVSELEKLYPDAVCTLDYEKPYELLFATRLAAQCTDARVNIVTKTLFAKYPSLEAFAEADIAELEQDVKPCGFYRNKAKSLKEMAGQLINDFGGVVPDTMEELLSLSGVGRKTANVIQSVAFGKSTMAVDTHVYRVAHRLGLVSKRDNTPYKVEMALTKHIPEADIPDAHHWLLLHGRYVCTSRKPHCDRCGLSDVCPRIL